MKNNDDFPSQAIVKRLREMYPRGSRVKLVHMGDDPYSKLVPGDKGTVSVIDDTGTIFVDWDRGSRLGMVYGVDVIRKL